MLQVNFFAVKKMPWDLSFQIMSPFMSPMSDLSGLGLACAAPSMLVLGEKGSSGALPAPSDKMRMCATMCRNVILVGAETDLALKEARSNLRGVTKPQLQKEPVLAT